MRVSFELDQKVANSVSIPFHLLNPAARLGWSSAAKP
jgi:hypothetical protein